MLGGDFNRVRVDRLNGDYADLIVFRLPNVNIKYHLAYFWVIYSYRVAKMAETKPLFTLTQMNMGKGVE